MAVDERARRNLYLWAEEQAGEEVSQTLMELLPPVGWADVATKQDLLPLATKADLADLRSEVAVLRVDLEGQITSLRADLEGQITSLRADLEGQITSLRVDLEGQDRSLRAEIQRSHQELLATMHAEFGAMRQDMAAQTRAMIFSVLGALVGLIGLAIAIGRLG